MDYKKELVRLLIGSEALRFGDFTLKSGRKSPYFLNAGMIRTGGHYEKLGSLYAARIMEVVGGDFEILFGPAYKGIPLAAAAACALWRDHGVDRAVCFNRKEVKDHGEGGILVGALPRDGDRIVIVEDVTTSGASVREVMPLLRAAADVRVTDMFTMLDRMEAGADGKYAVREIKEEFGITIHPIMNVRELIGCLRNEASFDQAIVDRMEEYVGQYCVRE